MKQKLILLVCLISAVLFSCSEDVEFKPIVSGPFTLDAKDLDGITVNEITIFGDWVFAATSDGVFGKKRSASNQKFVAMGLQGNNVSAIHPFTIAEILASVINNEQDGLEAKLYKTTNSGKNWSLFESNFGGDEDFKDGLSQFESVIGEPNHLYAVGNQVAAKSTDKGKTWEVIWGQWAVGSLPKMVIKANPSKPDELWFGGQGMIENGYLVKLKDEQQATEWWDLVPNPTVVKEIAFDYSSPQSIYIGWEGELSKSTDNGATWKTLIDRHEESHFFFGIGVSPSVSTTLYAGKWIKAAEAQILQIHYSSDGGETWETAEFPQISQGGVYDLKVIKQGQSDRLYVGLDKGGIVELKVANVVSTLD